MQELDQKPAYICVALGGKPYGISPVMLLELTSLKKPQYGSKSYLDNKVNKSC